MSNFDHFDADVTAEEVYGEDFSDLCGLCGTDHSNPDDEWRCLESQADEDGEPADIDDDRGINPYTGIDDDSEFWYDGHLESDLYGEM